MIPKKLEEEIDIWIRAKKYGSLQINFVKGVIVNVNRVESIKVESSAPKLVSSQTSY